jgi:hypothetical protein
MRYVKVKITDNLNTTSKDRYNNPNCDFKNKTSFDFYKIVAPHLKALGCIKIGKALWDIPAHLVIITKNLVENFPLRDGYGDIWFFKFEELE